MFKWLKKHWRVNNKDLVLILCTFFITGISIAWISRNVSSWLDIEKNSVAGWVVKLFVFFIGYQVMILIIGYCFGLFDFFWRFEKKILGRTGLIKRNNIYVAQMNPVNIAIFASGTGSNAQKIIEYFKTPANQQGIKRVVSIALIVSNNPGAGVVKIAHTENIPVILLEKSKFRKDGYIEELNRYNVHFIVLAGFMWKMPSLLIEQYPGKIINIHPALLPKYGGKNMYGNFVHEAVIKAGEKESGITIHYVDELYDHGAIIFQARCNLSEHETAASLAEKIHKLEHAHYPKVIESLVSDL
jgi:formyltetrahydrofolate-dependent phosphoribosylglycinamide formyltransferase